MIAFLIGLMLTAASPSLANSTVVCKIGSIALHDLLKVNSNEEIDTYYAGADANRPDLLTVCPKLKSELPKSYPIADDDARSRAAVHAPAPGQHVREAFIYSVGVPKISSDSKSAVVHFGFSCTGLCGAELEVRYIRTSKGWQRSGEIRMLSVS